MSSNTTSIRTPGRSRLPAWATRGRAWPWLALAAVFVLDAFRCRQRAAALRWLRPAPAPLEEAGYTVVAVDGVTVRPEAREAAVAHARAEGLAVLDLVPADLATESAYDLLHRFDPSRARHDRLSQRRGAAQALLVRDDVLARAGGAPAGPITPAALLRFHTEAHRCAPAETGAVVASGVHAVAESAEDRRAILDDSGIDLAPALRWLPAVGSVALLAGVVVAPLWGLVAIVAYTAAPVAALRGTPLGRAGRVDPLRALRKVRRGVELARTEGAPGTRPDPAAEAAERAEVQAIVAQGTAALFEPRRDTCPWCESTSLVEQVTCVDALQGKPGRFRLDRCEACGHVFQNPRLTLDGLDFVYRGFYDGQHGDEVDAAFAASEQPYRGRARLAKAHIDPEPERWLDVGAGHGHFCMLAAEDLPKTRFEALDLSHSIDEAVRRGWVAEGHIGLFPDLAGELGPYDVVSMHHYLEHTREPKEELAAARRALRPGGHLLIEVPDPECVYGRLLGRWWVAWFQPQHQHLVPLANLEAELARQGFSVVAVERAEAHQNAELVMASWFLLNRVGGRPGTPWGPPATFLTRARRTAAFLVLGPVFLGALVLDGVLGPILARRPGGSNAYRVLARLEAAP